jgi:hypothetical protein
MAMVDTVLPGGDGFPAASSVGCVEMLQREERFHASLDTFCALLPDDFFAASHEQRTAIFKDLEKANTSLLDLVIVAIYSAYYSRPEVLEVIKHARGYKATPPQPGGYALEPFDSDFLAVPASRPPQWRDPDKELIK